MATLPPDAITIDAYDEISYSKHIKDKTIKINSNNQLIINEVTGEYLKRYGWLNRNDFIDDSGDFHYIYNESECAFSNHALIARIDNGDTTYSYEYNQLTEEYIGADVDQIKINELCSLVDDLTGYETLCKIVDCDAEGQTVDIYVGYDYDRKLAEYGKLEYLYSNGYNVRRNFTLKFLRSEMPVISKYTRNVDETDRTEFLKYPVIPEESEIFYLNFDTPESSNYTFTGLVEEIDNIYGTWDNTTLLYNQEVNMEIPLYINTNKLGIKNTTNGDTYTYYTTYDNSNIELTIERSDDNENNLKCTLKNTTTNSIDPIVFTPLSTSKTILEVDALTNYNVGDCIKVHEDNANDTKAKEFYQITSANKYTITSMFEESLKYYIILDGVYPIGNDNTNMKFRKWDYSEMIHLQNFYLRGNPVVEEIEIIGEFNQTSIDAYGSIPKEISGSVIKKENLEDYINYLGQQFVGLSEDTAKFILNISTAKLFDIKVGDVISISDPVYTGLSNVKMLVIEKSFSRQMSGGNMSVSEDYKLLMISSFDNITPNTVNVKANNNYQYSNDLIKINKIEDIDLESRVIRFESKELGSTILEKIEKSIYKAKTNSNLNFQDKELDIYAIVGNKPAYNPCIFLYEKVVVKIGTEFLYVEGANFIDIYSTSTTLDIIERDIFNTGQNLISKEQDVTFYKTSSIVAESQFTI